MKGETKLLILSTISVSEYPSNLNVTSSKYYWYINCTGNHAHNVRTSTCCHIAFRMYIGHRTPILAIFKTASRSVAFKVARMRERIM